MLMNIIPEGCEGEETPEDFLTLVCVPSCKPNNVNRHLSEYHRLR